MVKRILRSFPRHYRDGKNVNLLVDCMNIPFQRFDVQKQNLKNSINIYTAQGSDIDVFGQLFKITRVPGEDDESLRTRILSFWGIYTRSGTKEDLKIILSTILNLNINDINIEEPETPLILQIEVSITPQVNIQTLNLLNGIVISSKAAGVYIKPTKLISKNGGFITNMSKVNGGDIVL